MSTTPAPLEGQRLNRRDCEFVTAITAATLIGQIKLTRIHAAFLFLPGVRVKRDRRLSLYNVERSGDRILRRSLSPNFVSLLSHSVYLTGIVTITSHSPNPKGSGGA